MESSTLFGGISHPFRDKLIAIRNMLKIVKELNHIVSFKLSYSSGFFDKPRYFMVQNLSETTKEQDKLLAKLQFYPLALEETIEAFKCALEKELEEVSQEVKEYCERFAI